MIDFSEVNMMTRKDGVKDDEKRYKKWSYFLRLD